MISDNIVEEEWRACKEVGYEHYEVSNFGRVRNTKKNPMKILRSYVSSYRYLKYDLQSGGKKKKKYAHRLVWETWHEDEIQFPMQVDHIDNNPKNNRLDNLQLLTPRDNTLKRPRVAKRGEGWQRNCPKVKNPMCEETKEKLRAKSNAYWADPKKPR